MKFQHALCWIRRDLRLSDHRALMEACRASDRVTLVFFYDTTILNKLNDQDDRRVTFIHSSVQEMDQNLRKKGSALVTLYGDPRKEIPSLATKLSVEAVFCNHDYEPSAKERDETVAKTLQSMGIQFFTYKDQVVFEGLEVSTKSGSAFRIFTPFKNAWLRRLTREDIQEFRPNLNKLTSAKGLKEFLKPCTLDGMGVHKAELWLEAGESAARKRLVAFIKKLERYEKERDLPSAQGTSRLSVHLRFGTISIRKLARFALKQKSKGAEVWLSELIWRDFYQMILDRFPRVSTSTFKLEYNTIEWPGTDRMFIDWCHGKTGYPLIDAAMRHFNETGWMHNRLRMIVASFLVKDLLVDWRKGESYFARFLLDFDLAANNGGWQWCASTGCDAQPWFRIFNPITQSKRFDPEGKFIGAAIPELTGFSNKDIHFPYKAGLKNQKKASCIIGKDYPKPLVDHATQREKSLMIFKNALKK